MRNRWNKWFGKFFLLCVVVFCVAFKKNRDLVQIFWIFAEKVFILKYVCFCLICLFVCLFVCFLLTMVYFGNWVPCLLPVWKTWSAFRSVLHFKEDGVLWLFHCLFLDFNAATTRAWWDAGESAKGLDVRERGEWKTGKIIGKFKMKLLRAPKLLLRYFSLFVIIETSCVVGWSRNRVLNFIYLLFGYVCEYGFPFLCNVLLQKWAYVSWIPIVGSFWDFLLGNWLQ